MSEMFKLLIDFFAPDVELPRKVDELVLQEAADSVIGRLKKARNEEKEAAARRIAEIAASELIAEEDRSFARAKTRIEFTDEMKERLYRPHTRPNLKAKCLSFPAKLILLVKDKCDGVGKIAYARAGVSRQIYSRIVSWEDSRADKNTVMRFCLGLQLTKAEADGLMQAAGYAFSLSLPVDCVVVHAIEHKIWNINDVAEILQRVNSKLTI